LFGTRENGNCIAGCNRLGNWRCNPASTWKDKNCEILENRFKIKCNVCDNTANLGYPAYEESGDTIICYSGTGSAECGAAAGSTIRLCACDPQ